MSDSQTATDCNEAKPLDERKLRAVDLLAIGRPITEVAAELSIDRVTLWRWRHEAAFTAELNGRRAELWQASTDRLRALLPSAADVLEQALAADDVRAALALVKLAGFGALGQVGLTDVEAIVAEQQRRQAAHERLRRSEEYERAEDEVRQLEQARHLELRRVLAA